MIKSFDVLLVYPYNTVNWPRLPNAVLALAGSLIRHGFTVKICDISVDDYRDFDCNDCIFAGISALSDPGITKGLEVAAYIRDKWPHVPLVWGGPHPSALPDQTLGNPLVDLVCRGEGETTVVELANALQHKKSLESIKGLSWKNSNGEIFHNPTRPFENLDEHLLYPYDIVDLKKYPSARDVFPYQSSRGCPYKCTFCSFDPDKRWRSRSPLLVADDLEKIVKLFNPRLINFSDEEMFISQKRIVDICHEIIKRNIKIKWAANCRFNLSAKYDDEFLQLLRQSGCDMLCFGAESGSDRVLELIQKQINREHIIESIKRLKKNSLRSLFSFMCGFPFETVEDFELTLSLIEETRRLDPTVCINGLFIYAPYPGSQLFETVQEHHYKPPKSLEEWGRAALDIVHENSTTPWLNDKTRARLEIYSAMVRFRFFRQRFWDTPIRTRIQFFKNSRILMGIVTFLLFFFYVSERIRFKNRWTALSFEWRAWIWVRDRYLGQT
jgi:anaerobic magnesium-protoporphyrin IX monomethyl ester cyclase